MALIAALNGMVPALAGDRAQLDILGYSEDGRYFAFAQYGIQDGSGFAYADVFILDLPADKWMYGSPFHAQGGDANPEHALGTVRSQALAQAEDTLKETGIVVPATLLALIGDGVLDTDGKTLTVSGTCCGLGQGGAVTLTLSTFPITAAEDYCAAETPVGYGLTLEQNGSSTDMHRDGAILPASRGCTLDYRLYAVVEPFTGGAGPRVAIISAYRKGFEGPDRRFLAVPLNK